LSGYQEGIIKTFNELLLMKLTSFPYYKYSICLKGRAFVHRLRDYCGLNSKFQKNESKHFKKIFQSQKVHFSDHALAWQDYYYTYFPFKQPKDLELHLIFDDSGVAKCSKESLEFQQYYNPLFAAYYGLICFNHFIKTKNKKSLDKFWTQVYFLENFVQPFKGQLILSYHFDYKKYNLEKGWYAGITQSLGSSLFLRAFQLSKEHKYQNIANKLLGAMFIPIEEGGILVHNFEGHPWIEEYPSSPPSYVLNGYLFCLIGLAEYRALFEYNFPISLERLFKSFFQNFHRYKYGFDIRYCLYRFQFSNIQYQGLYIFLFLHLFLLTKAPVFKTLLLEFLKKMNWPLYFRRLNSSLNEKKMVDEIMHLCHSTKQAL